MRVQSPVLPKSCAFAISMKPARAAALGIGGDCIFEIAQHDIDLA